MTLRPSSVPLRVPLPAPPESSLPEVPDPELAGPTISCLLATADTDPCLDSPAAYALVAKLLDFAVARCIDYATSLFAESASANPPSVAGECALGTVVHEDRQEDFECLAPAVPRFASMLLAPEGDPDPPDIPTPRSYAEAITGPYSSQWQAAMDAKMASWKSTGTYVDEVPPPEVNIVDGMWIFRVKWPPGSPPVFKARYVARGFRQRQGVDYFHTFSPTLKLTTLWVLLHVAAQRDYNFPSGQPARGDLVAPQTWTTLAALGFAPAAADMSLFLRTDTLLPPFYVLVYVDDLVFATADTKALTLVKSELQKRHTCTDLEPSGPYLELVGCLMYLMTCTRPDLAYPLNLVAPCRHRKVHWDAAKRVLRYLCITSGIGLVLGGRGPVVLTSHADASWVDESATQRSSQGYTFNPCSGLVSWRSTRSSSVLSSSCEAEIYAGAMAAQELHWLTFLLFDLGEQPSSPPVLYLDNKAMIALCQEHRLDYKTKHIALRYFLARELQQRGQLRLAYMATRANTTDIFTKALLPCDHQCFCTALGVLALLFLTGLVTTCSPPLCLWGRRPCRLLPYCRLHCQPPSLRLLLGRLGYCLLLQLHAVLLQLIGRKQFFSHARDIEHVGDEHLPPSLPLQSDIAAALDILLCPIEATYVLDVAAQLQVDEDLLRPHQLVGSTTIEQNYRRVCLHGCRHRLEVLAGLRRQQDGRLHDADQRLRRLLVVSPFASSKGAGVLRRG
ncbi:unnamed protein product [Closterium sp. NIES-53]